MDTEPPAEVTPESALALVTPPSENADALILNDPGALAAQVASYGESRRLLLEWLFSQLTPGVDYTLIHRKVGPRGTKTDCPEKADVKSRGCPTCGGKSTLCKPGSEKLCGLLRLRPRFTRDTETWEMLGSEPGLVALKCELVTPSGVVVAEGRGARHRDQDFGDVNKTVKMTQKSGQTDGVLRLFGLSEIFTQDLEDMPGGFDNAGDSEAGAFQAPRRKSEPTAPPAPATLQAQLEESVRRTAPTAPRPAAPRPAPRAAPRAPAVPAAARDTREARNVPPDALSPARVNRLMALLHEALRGAEVPQEEHERVFDAARTYLVEWVGRTQGRERLSDCSWRAYDELCAQVPAAVDAALGGDPEPAPRARPRLVRRYAGPRSMNVPRRQF